MPNSPTPPIDALRRVPQLGVDGLILEGVVTTINEDGSPNISPMGPIVDAEISRLHLRPFSTSKTFANLQRGLSGVFHVTDDADLIARAAIGRLADRPALRPAESTSGVILSDACRWYEFTVDAIDASQDRTDIFATVVDRGIHREFLGFNRAKHAVIEAAILATRVEFIPRMQILQEIDRLRTIVDKTGSAAEHEAFALIQQYLRDCPDQ